MRLTNLSFAFILFVVAGCGSSSVTVEEEGGTGGKKANSGGKTGSTGESTEGIGGGTGISGIGGFENVPGTWGSAGIFLTAGSPGFRGDAGRTGFTGGAGQFGQNPNDQNVTIDQTPPPVQTTITTELGNAPIDEIQVNNENGTTTYEVEATVNGNQVELNIAADGTVLSKAEEIALTELPAAVQAAVNQAAAGATIQEAEKVTEGGKISYEVRASSAQGGRIRLTIAEDGTILEQGNQSRG
jgi:hypothetical protein